MRMRVDILQTPGTRQTKDFQRGERERERVCVCVCVYVMLSRSGWALNTWVTETGGNTPSSQAMSGCSTGILPLYR